MTETSILEIYKELGTHERHFNTIQGVYRGLASTWFLACFAAIGFIYSKDNKFEIPFNTELVASLTATVVSSGIFLFWLLDVVVYHRLLLAVISTTKNFEMKNSDTLPSLRSEMEGETKCFYVRKAISIYYFVQILILVITALLLLIKGWSCINSDIRMLQSLWLSMLVVVGIIFISTQHR